MASARALLACPEHAAAGAQALFLLRTDHVLFTILVIGLGFLWTWYRRENNAEGKIRLAALAALASVVFLSVTSAMPWLSMPDDLAGGRPVTCLLGQEGACVFRAGVLGLMADAREPSLLAFDVERWQCASTALRMGQVTSLALLLPALIWLMVDPRHRAAQAATAVGASVAGFTLLVVLLYRQAVPEWIDARMFWTVDLALVASASIVVAAVLIVRQSFLLSSRVERLPRADLR